MSQVFAEFGLLALASYVLLGVALSEPDRRPPITRVLISGIVGYAIALSWILGFGGVPWVLLVLLHLLFVLPTGLAAGFVLRKRPNALAGAAVLGGIGALSDWARGLGAFGVSMASPAGSIARNLIAVQWVSVVGGVGVAFAIAWLGYWVGFSVRARPVKTLVTALVIVVAAHLGGWWLLQHRIPASGQLRAAAIQGVVTDGSKELVKHDQQLKVYVRLSEEAVRRDGARLVVWPETSVPGDMSYGGDVYARLSSHFVEMNAAGLTGGFISKIGDLGSEETRNSVYAFGNQGELLGAYEKMRLTPLGEYVPYRDYLPSLEQWGVLKSDYAEGRYWPPIEIAGARIGVLICSESMFSAMGVERVQQGADVLAIVSNDSWFGKGCGVEQLARLSILRAVECRRSVVRASETGYSMLIDPCGRVVKQSTLYQRASVTGILPLSNNQSPFVQRGQYVPLWIAGIVVLALVWVVVRGKGTPASKIGPREALRRHDGGFETGGLEELLRDQKEGRNEKE